jgi:hypothetical protein
MPTNGQVTVLAMILEPHRLKRAGGDEEMPGGEIEP